MVSAEDQASLKKRHLRQSDLDEQIARLHRGTVSLHIIRPCRLNDGIIKLSDDSSSVLQKAWAQAVHQGRVSKFIPASGAATRMFQSLLQYLNDPSKIDPSIPEMMNHLEQFPFYDDLSKALSLKNLKLDTLRLHQEYKPIVEALLSPAGLNYAGLPKALLPFHRYPGTIRTALEEHIQEAVQLIQDGQGITRCHLTVSPEHRDAVHRHIVTLQETLALQGHHLKISLSVQSPSTETVALDSTGNLVRTEKGEILFRPGGHGALLQNLHLYEGDLVQILNIDNVVPDHLKNQIMEWRAALGGYLVTLQAKIFSLLKGLTQSPTRAVLQECERLTQQELGDPLPSFYPKWTLQGQAAFFRGHLNRPLRICGMVQNTGDAGGGPFWVEDQTGTHSKQIVEQAQIDPTSPSQQDLFQASTHFNPVDMVCGVRDLRGNLFPLPHYSDPDTAFVTQKSYAGHPITVLEWPGLWNGGMAHWITVFVEVPRSTFNPVKTYLDWLHPSHQPPS